jgi:hypothetical protein
MGIGYEGRSRMCWGCLFFVQSSEQYRNGKCVRHAPKKIDGTVGETTDGSPLFLSMFANVLDSETGFCGKFVPATITPSATIPPQEPGTPV